MKPLAERYREYCDEYKANVEKALAEAGLPPIGVNSLRYLYYKIPFPLTFEEYASINEQAEQQAARNTIDEIVGITSANAIKGIKYGKSQSKKAKKPRGKVGDDGKTVSEIIGWLATSAEHQEESTKGLWNLFLGKLDRLLLHPKEISRQSGGINKLACKYNVNGSGKSITFGQFAKVVSAFRTGKKLP